MVLWVGCLGSMRCVGSRCKGGPLNLSVHTVLPITSSYQMCLQFSSSLLEVVISGAYSSNLSAWLYGMEFVQCPGWQLDGRKYW